MDLLVGQVLGLLDINEVQSPGLNLTVDKGTSKCSKDILGLCVAVRVAYYRKDVLTYPYLQTWLYLPNGEGGKGGCIRTVLSNVVLVGFGCLVASGTGD
jgi:hypothetical protein